MMKFTGVPQVQLCGLHISNILAVVAPCPCREEQFKAYDLPVPSTNRTSAIRRNAPPSTTASVFSRILSRLSSAISSRRRQETRECAVCLQNLSLTVFPAITPTCTHVPNICKECINTWLSTDGVLTALTWYDIRCPSQGCGEVIQPADMSQFCTSEIFAR